MEREALQTYTRAWKLELMLYKIENWTLPFPVSFEQVWVFLCALGLIVLLRMLPFVGGLVRSRPFFWWVLVPMGITWFLTRTALDGKNPLRYVYCRLRHWASPYRIIRYRRYALPTWHRWLSHFRVRPDLRRRRRWTLLRRHRCP